jgi:hypothetical protein
LGILFAFLFGRAAIAFLRVGVLLLFALGSLLFGLLLLLFYSFDVDQVVAVGAVVATVADAVFFNVLRVQISVGIFAKAIKSF